MAGYFDKTKDYSLAIVQAQQRGASQAEISQLRRERQNKIDAKYGGVDPYKGKNDIMGTGSRGSAAFGSGTHGQRIRNNDTLKGGGVLPGRHGSGPLQLTSPFRPEVDYAAEAEKYADEGNWDAVDDILMRRQYKIDAQGGNDRGLSNLELWNRLRRERGLDRDLPWGPAPQRPSRPAGGGYSGGGYSGGGYSGGGYSGGGYSGGGYSGGGYSGGLGGDYLLQLYQQQAAEAEARLKAKFEADMAGIRAHYEAMGGLYDQLRNQQAAQNELERLRLNELGLSQGLNSGAFGQLSLGRSGEYQNAFASIGRQEAAEKAQGDWKLKELESAYRGAVAEAKARGQADLMDKLYREYVRNVELEERRRSDALDRMERERRYRDSLLRQEAQDRLDAQHDRRDQENQSYREALNRAETLARHGNFSGYLALGYTQQEVDAMKQDWLRQQAKKKK